MSSESAAPASPCQRKCCLDEQNICLGCGRSMQEILDWGAADAQRRRQICEAAEARLRARKSPS
ncbi:DUF1289 domain-containing protein [Pseudomonas sp. GOM7]|uniref:DUF1289 domain-containing protein n=1 Tax=unclassified Pseudomonas TaxID=196821 RepID=UPI00227B1580|nr:MULTISPECIES: DUF1289 domain-containing protein [unclassified Pseudomonas]WAJ37937.1 DUF1289 domain-containing protein [Pseudomonas sp. GOM7]